jgi:hypothetical protein
MSPIAQPPKRRWRLTAFRVGFLAGFALPLVGVILSLIVIEGLLGQRWPGRYNVEVISRGNEISAHGAARVVVGGEHGSVTQACRGACDDLLIRETSGEDSYRVTILDGRGRRLTCGGIGYVTSGLGLDRMILGGSSRVTIRSSNIRKAPDGALREEVHSDDGVEACAREASRRP